MKVLAERPEGRIVFMAAFRTGVPLPVGWKTLQKLEPDSSRVRYLHIGGVTRGMRVEWRLTSGPRGVEATIVHDFAPPWPWPGPWIARVMVCGFFVHAIADQTLAGIKAVAEGLVERQGPFDTYTRPQSSSLPSDRSRRPGTERPVS